MTVIADIRVAPDNPRLAVALTDARLPTEDLADGAARFFHFADEGRTIGFGGYALYGEDALLRSIVVLPAERGKGLGRIIVRRVLDHARDAGAGRAFLLTTDGEAFFTRMGFTPIARETAPPAILATRQATMLCSSAALLMLPLVPGG